MRVKLTYRRADGSSSDIVVTADARSTIAELAQTIERVDPVGFAPTVPSGSRTLAALLPGQTEPVVLPPDAPLGEAWIGSGAVVQVVDKAAASRPDMRSGPVRAVVRVVSGPGAGRAIDLHAGSYVVGRAADSDIVLEDPLVSKRHARIEVGEEIELVDLGSANGIEVDGGAVTRVHVHEPLQLTLGDTSLRIEPRAVAVQTGLVAKAGPVPFVRSPRVEPRYQGVEFAPPDVPVEQDKPPFNPFMLIAPVLMGGGMFMLTQNPMSLMFVVMSPVMMMGNFLNQRRGAKFKRKRAVARFESHLAGLREELAKEAVVERRARLQESVATPLALAEANRRGPLLWTRRPEHWSFLNVRFGIATMPTRCTISQPSRGELVAEYQQALDELVSKHVDVEGVPVIENLHDAGSVGVAGPPEIAEGSLAAVLVQLTALHSPAELVTCALVPPTWSERLQWLKWLPHSSSAHSPLEGPHLADSASSASVLLAQLEELVAARLQKAQQRGAVRAQDGALDRGATVGVRDVGGYKAPIPAVVVVIAAGVDLDTARLAQLTELGADAGVFPIWVAPDVADLPAACRTFLSFDEAGRATVSYVRLGRVVEDVQVEQVDSETSLAFARRLSPVFDAGAVVEDSSDLPRSISLVTLLGHDMFSDPAAVVDRWRENSSLVAPLEPGQAPRGRRKAGPLRAIVGSAGVDPLHLDLRSQGPHALVGGTTGAGKSEFLQAWVLGLAAEYSPQRVTFLFVDYKGGSAFAECVNLPHCVGLVTDLSPHLVRRALTSLRAELHYRERLFNRKKAKDLLELEKRGDPEAPPALVLVFDEFAALVSDVPEFVDGVVDIAQRGRSLGIHLVMATQRPAGVIKDNLRANTNLRVALRMADESDSTDVIGVPDAAAFDPSIPGRGVVKSGPGRLHPFQSAYAGGWTSAAPSRAGVEVAHLRFGAEVRWEEPVDEDAAPAPEEDLGPNDQQRLVRTIRLASRQAGLAPPRRPWLPELAPLYDLTKLRQRTDAELLLGVSDHPAHQEQIPVYFRPDTDGHLAVYGTGGTGKSTTLRTLAAAAGITPRGGPVHVYGLDFAAGGLRMLEDLPHVGAVIPGDDVDRVVRLFRTLREELDRRAPLFAEASAASITEYRELANAPELARILVLLDGFPAFRDDFEVGPGRSQWYEVFRDVLAEGRQLGIHVALTADRPGSVSTSVRSAVQRNVLLRLADDSYRVLDEPDDVLSAGSPPGRAVMGGLETQIAVVGGLASVAEQARATKELGAAMLRAGVRPAPVVGSLPTEYPASQLPDSVDGLPVLGLSDVDLGPVGFDPDGVLLLAGPPGSGRTNAAAALALALRRAGTDVRCYLVADSRSPLVAAGGWTDVASGVEQVTALAQNLTAAIEDEETEGRIVVVVENLNEYLQGPADKPLVDLIKAVKKSSHTLVADADTAAWGPTWPLLAEVKSARRGLLLQPDASEGEILLKTGLPRVQRSELPPGRGFFVARGKFVRVQLPLVLR